MYALRPARSLQKTGAADGSYFDPHFRCRAFKLLPGEYVTSTQDLMLVTVLGSCVAACIRDPLAQVGGMNHFMLPDSDDAAGAGSARYGSYAMEMLINALLKAGAQRSRLEAKLFGGGAVLPGFTATQVGERNVAFALKYLKAEGIRLLAQDLGGFAPRRVHYQPLDGRAFVRALPSAQGELVVAETRYLDKLRGEQAVGSVELF